MGCCINGSDTYAELVLEVKQNESRSFGFTIEQNDEPLDLTGYTVNFLVKKAPYPSLENLIEKTITEEYVDNVGYIYEPTDGKFYVIIDQEDTTKLPPYDYSLVVEITNGEQVINISGNGNTRSVFRVCHQ